MNEQDLIWIIEINISREAEPREEVYHAFVPINDVTEMIRELCQIVKNNIFTSGQYDIQFNTISMTNIVRARIANSTRWSMKTINIIKKESD